MATSDNMTTVPAAPTAIPSTSAGRGLDAAEWKTIVGVVIPVIMLIIAIVTCRPNGVCRRLLMACIPNGVFRRLREGRRRQRSGSQGDGGEGDGGDEGTPLTPLPTTASAGETNGTRSDAEQRQAEQAAASRCMEALKELYQTTGSYVQMSPWVDDDRRKLKDIYTKLKLEKGDDDLDGEVKSYWDIFKLVSEGGHPIIRSILRGWAGLGKTTLLWKIAYDWACGTVDALKKYKLVFVLNMKSLQRNSDVIDAVFEQLLDEDDVNREDLKTFITANPKDVLFLLDGFDELKSTELDETNFGSLHKMLHRKGEYKKCIVLITTRPSHYDKLVNRTLIERPFALVNVEGFSKDDVKKYVHNYYLEEPTSKANELLEKIMSSYVLSDLAKSPMLLLLMCLLWEESASLPDTMFRLYNRALLYIFKRKIKGEFAHIPLDKPIKSIPEVLRVVIAIGKVALDGLLSPDQKLSFKEDEFDEDVLDMARRAGILTSKQVGKVSVTCTVSFIHKTFQEFCAAVYYQSLTLEGETQQFETFFRGVSDTAGFEYLLRFCCGDNDGPNVNSILNILLRKVPIAGYLDDKNLRLALNCYFESQSQTLPPMELINSVIAQDFVVANDLGLSRDHSTSLMHFLKNVTDEKKGGGNACLERIHSLFISGKTFLMLGADFVNHVNRMAFLHEIDVFNMIFTTGSENYLSQLISSLRLNEMTQLNTVGFQGCVPTASNMEHIIGKVGNLPNLVVLDLSRNETLAGSDGSGRRSWNRLSGIESLNKLDLGMCGLKSYDLKPIAVGLSNLPHLVELNLSHNETLVGSGRPWYHLGGIKTLNKLDLSGCGLKSDDLEHIAIGLGNLPNLVELNLSRNTTLAGSGRSWFHLGKIKTLKKLNLGNCGLKSDDLKHIAVGLRNLPNFVELNLFCAMTASGTGQAWSHLGKIKTLNELDLQILALKSNDLEPIAVGPSNLPNLNEVLDQFDYKTLAGSGRSWFHLKKIKTLKKLDLGNCGLKSDDLEHIAVGLSNLPNLVELRLVCSATLAGSGRAWFHLERIKTLNKLDLSRCGLTSDDLEHIAVGLSNLPSPVELRLFCNDTLVGSGRAWSHLGRIKTLNKLDLTYCDLGSDDLKPIAVGLSNLPNLVELDLSGNKNLAGLGQSWCHLGEIETLNKLDLSQCGLVHDDLEHIAEALGNLPNLVELSLSRNYTLAGSGRSWSVLAEIKHLRKLDLSSCDLTADDKTQITEAVSQMTNLELNYEFLAVMGPVAVDSVRRVCRPHCALTLLH